MITENFQNADSDPSLGVVSSVSSLLRGPHNGLDSKLVREAAKGVPGAWHALVEKYSAYVYAVVRSTGTPEHEQADAFQYVFVELFKSLNSLSKTDILSPWLRQTAIRHCLRLREKRLKQGSSLDDMEALVDPLEIEEEVIKADQAQKIRESVGSLQDKCRELIHRLFLESPPQPYAEVAEALGIKTSSIAMTRQRCLEALEKALRARGVL